jgi:CheY-like chemotaxis protein
VDDNAVNQRLALHLVEKQGHSVAAAGTGREALAALAREPFDLVLMDMRSSPMKVMESGPGAGIRITVEYPLPGAGGEKRHDCDYRLGRWP